MKEQINQLGQQAKQASHDLAQLPPQKKSTALQAMARCLERDTLKILSLNQQEVSRAKAKGLTPALIDRMTLSKKTIMTMVKAINHIAQLKEPVGRELASWSVDSGLQIKRIAVPIGVIAIIYESRPNVTADAAALCFKSGNACILRGGSDCALTNQAIVKSLHGGLKDSGLATEMIQYFPTQERDAIDHLLHMSQYVDVIIPRGGKSLIQRIRENSQIPVFSHLDGICHTYVHNEADMAMAVDIVANAKMRRTGICGATETLLVDEAIADIFLPKVVEVLVEHGCIVRGDTACQALDKRIQPATEVDWRTEYLDAIISVKLVKHIEMAIEHIEYYGSHHTDAIITNNAEVAKLFLNKVNSAIVMHNCSTQFADGGEFGLGAEIGIATGKLHARGPVGIEQLTTFKYLVEGNGQTRPA